MYVGDFHETKLQRNFYLLRGSDLGRGEGCETVFVNRLVDIYVVNVILNKKHILLYNLFHFHLRFCKNGIFFYYYVSDISKE